MSQAGWYNDPTKTYMYRYWDGTQWTNQVNSGGATNTDPNPLDPAVASTPPAPGTEATQEPAKPAVQVSQQSSGGGGGGFFGALIGVLIAVIIIVGLIVLLSDSDDSSSTTAPPAPTTTEAPATTTAP